MLILASTVTGCVSISAFAWLVCIPIGITSSAVGINICVITAVIKKCESITKKKKKKHCKIEVLLGKDKLNTIEVIISKALIDSCISNDEFVSVNNVLREDNEMKKKFWKFPSICYIKTMETYYVSCKKYTKNKNSNVRGTQQNRLMLLSNCAVCGNKNWTFIKNKELRNFD